MLSRFREVTREPEHPALDGMGQWVARRAAGPSKNTFAAVPQGSRGGSNLGQSFGIADADSDEVTRGINSTSGR